MGISVKRGIKGEGHLISHFEVEGIQYYASLTSVGTTTTECMVFQHNTWKELYCKRGIEINEQNLRMCVEDFVRKLAL